MKILIILLFFSVGNVFSNPFKPKYCYFKVDFKVNQQNIFTQKIICKTKETAITDVFFTELKIGNTLTDSSIILVKYFKIGKKRHLIKHNSVNINLQLLDKSGAVIEEINGEILKNDWICNQKFIEEQIKFSNINY